MSGPDGTPRVGILIGGKRWPWHDRVERELQNCGVIPVMKTGDGDWGTDSEEAGRSGRLPHLAVQLVEEGCEAILAGDSQSTVAASLAAEMAVSAGHDDIPVFAVIGFLTKIRHWFEPEVTRLSESDRKEKLDRYVKRIVGFFGEHSVTSGDRGDWDGLSMLVGLLNYNEWAVKDYSPVAILYNEQSSSSTSELQDLSASEGRLCVRDRIRQVPGLEELEVKTYPMPGHIDGKPWSIGIDKARSEGCKSLVIIEDPVFGMEFDSVIGAIAAKKFRPENAEDKPFPACFETKIAVDAGALMSYGWDRMGAWLAAARMVGTRVSRGQMSELRAFGQRPHRQHLFVNQWVANQLDLSVPLWVRVPQAGPENLVPVEDWGWQFRDNVPSEFQRPQPRK